jgi:thioredoxin 1
MVELTIDNFEKEVKEGTVIIDFWAPWCGPCRIQGPILERLAEELPDVKVAKVNVDNEPVLAQAFNVMSIPTLVFYRDGKQFNKVIGLHDLDSLKEILAK